jgi:thiol-disulfide isomerase/thioredoxin
MKAVAAYATQNNVLLVIGILLLIALGIYGYYKYTEKPKYVDNKEFETDSSSSSSKKPIEVYYFRVDWCPHCKKADPIWENLQSGMPAINGRDIIYTTVNCEDDKEGKSGGLSGRQLASKFEVTGYPTIKMVNNKQVIEYDAKPELDTLKQFIRTSA